MFVIIFIVECGVANGIEGRCSRLFWDDLCDTTCDDENHLYDGYDCTQEQYICDTQYDEQCRHRFGDGVCDRQCNTPGCAWDGGDCVDQPLKFAEDVIMLSVARWYQSTTYGTLSKDQSRRLARTLSQLLRTVVRIMPMSWLQQHGLDSIVDVNSQQAVVFARIDNTHCKQRCINSATTAVRYISVALINGWDPGIPLARVAGQYHFRLIIEARVAGQYHLRLIIIG